MSEFSEYGELVAKGGIQREFTEHRVLTDEQEVRQLEEVLGEKPDHPHHSPTVFKEVDDGCQYTADYSSTQSVIVDFLVSDDRQSGVLEIIEV